MLTKADIKRLPKYVQRHIFEADQTNIRLSNRIKTILSAKYPDSNVGYIVGYGPDCTLVNLPHRVKINMRDKNDNVATIYMENEVILIHCNGGLDIRPKSNNYIGIRMSNF